MKVAFIGLGNMGSGMAARVLKNETELAVWNRSREKMGPLVAAGARAATDPADAAQHADVVITCLLDDASVLGTAQSHLLDAMKPGAVHLGVTTVSPRCSDELARLHAANGTVYVAGPVVGRPDAAAAGELTSLLGGEEAAVQFVMPVCRYYSRVALYVAKRHGTANALKLAVNYMVVSIIEAMGEVYAFADKAGVPIEPLQEFLVNAMNHPALKMYAAKIGKRDFAGRGGFAMAAGLKDVKLMQAAAGEMGVALEIGEIARRKMEAALAAGMVDTDWSATYEMTRRNFGLD
jgi:3-hydroxyisobutyrate dehydrogenase-like beta-hydroxyacid dehydrogenase